MSEHRESMRDPSRFGDTHRLLEYSRDAWGWNWLDDALQDLKLGMRGLMRAPAFAITGVLILTFGIGLNLTVFQVANVVLLRGPAVPRPDTLARLHRHGQAVRSNSEAVPYVAAMAAARENTALSAVLVESTAPVVWGESADVIEASFVSANWFSELGGAPLLGRVFAPQVDGAADAPPAAIASHRFWKTTLAADPGVIGTSIRINDRPATLIGVMPETFPELDLDASAVWLSITQRDYYFPNSTFLTDWGSNNVAMYGRLKDGVTAAAARESLRAVIATFHREQPAHFDAGDWLEPVLATDNFTESAERLGFIGVASTFGLLSTMVLLVAAANLGNLVMSKRDEPIARARTSRRAWRGPFAHCATTDARDPAIGRDWRGGRAAVFFVGRRRRSPRLGGLPPYLDFTPDLTAIGLSLLLTAFALALVGALPAWRDLEAGSDRRHQGRRTAGVDASRSRPRPLADAGRPGRRQLPDPDRVRDDGPQPAEPAARRPWFPIRAERRAAGRTVASCNQRRRGPVGTGHRSRSESSPIR